LEWEDIFLINREGSQENPIKKLNDINLNDQPGGSLLPPARDEEQKNEEEKELSDFDKREVVAKNRLSFLLRCLVVILLNLVSKYY